MKSDEKMFKKDDPPIEFTFEIEIKDKQGNPKKDVEVNFKALQPNTSENSDALELTQLTAKTDTSGIAKTTVKVLSEEEARIQYSYTIDKDAGGDRITINESDEDDEDDEEVD